MDAEASSAFSACFLQIGAIPGILARCNAAGDDISAQLESLRNRIALQLHLLY